MNTLTELNTFSADGLTFNCNAQIVARTIGSSFVAPQMTWEVIRALGPLTSTGVRVSFNTGTANTTVTFPASGQSTNPLTITNPSAGVYVISGIINILDYNASQGQVNPQVGNTGNVAYSVTYTNVNSATGDFVVPYTGVPV
jgi:hypothetical protein